MDNKSKAVLALGLAAALLGGAACVEKSFGKSLAYGAGCVGTIAGGIYAYRRSSRPAAPAAQTPSPAPAPGAGPNPRRASARPEYSSVHRANQKTLSELAKTSIASGQKDATIEVSYESGNMFTRLFGKGIHAKASYTIRNNP